MLVRHDSEICSLGIITQPYGETVETLKRTIVMQKCYERRKILIHCARTQNKIEIQTFEAAGFQKVGTYRGNDGPGITVLISGLTVRKPRKQPTKQGASAPKRRRAAS